MPEPKSELRSALPPRQILLASDKADLVERIEMLQRDLEHRMEVEEELLHLNLQKGTASLQSQVEEASRRFKIAQQELEAFRLEILNAAGDPAGLAPRPYIYEDLSAPPQEGPGRDQFRSLLTLFRRLRDERDGFREALGQSKGEAERLRSEVVEQKTSADKAAANLAALGVTLADLEVAQQRLRQETEAARAESDQLRSELAQARLESGAAAIAAPPSVSESGPSGAEFARLQAEADGARSEARQLRDDLERERSAALGEREALALARREAGDLEASRDRLEQEKADARAEAEKALLALQSARDAQARAIEEAVTLRAAGEDLDHQVEILRGEAARSEERAQAQIEEQAELGRRLAYEQAKTERQAVESRELIGKLAQTARLLEEARFELEHPDQTVGFERFEKFLAGIHLRELFEKHVRGAGRSGQTPLAPILYEILAAAVGAQESPLEGARNLIPRITRPRREPGLGEMRQLVERLKTPELEGVARVHDALRASFFPAAKRSEPVVVDVDLLELLLGGAPQTTTSYWPIVMYVPELQEFWHGRLRPAAELAPRDVALFLSEGLARVPSKLDRSRLRVRLDARFYDPTVVRLLETRGCSYVAAAPDAADLRAASRSAAYAEVSPGWEAAEWSSKGSGARASASRMVALRHLRSAQPMPSVPFLFRDPQYVYHVFAVDRRISPWEALQVYAAREGAQEREHALLRDFTLNRLLGRGSEAHSHFFPLFLLAADLIQWYRRESR